MRISDEIDAGQERGEVASQGGDSGKTNVRASDIEPSTLSDLGVDRRRLDEWRDTRDALQQLIVRQAAVEAELRLLRTAVERRPPGGRVAPDRQDCDVVQQIARLTGGKPFTSAALLARYRQQLADALRATGTEPSSAEVGRLLRRVRGHNIAGVVVEKLEQRTKAGERWVVRRAGVEGVDESASQRTCDSSREGVK